MISRRQWSVGGMATTLRQTENINGDTAIKDAINVYNSLRTVGTRIYTPLHAAGMMWMCIGNTKIQGFGSTFGLGVLVVIIRFLL